MINATLFPEQARALATLSDPGDEIEYDMHTILGSRIHIFLFWERGCVGIFLFYLCATEIVSQRVLYARG